MLSAKRLEMGKTGYGASEVPALVAPSKWANPATLYLKRLHPELDTGSSLVSDLGILLEEPIAALYARQRPEVCLARVETIRHPGHAIAIATPDRAVFRAGRFGSDFGELPREHLVAAERLLQIKTTDDRMRPLWGEPGTDAVPENYLAQVTWEMGVAGVHLCDVAVLFGRSEFGVYTVPFNRELFEGLLEIVERFDLEHVKAQVPPPADAGERYRDLLKSLYPRALSPVREASPVELETARRYALWREVEKRAEVLKDREGNALRAAMGDAMGLTLGEFGSLSYKNNRDGSKVDWKAVAEECHGYAAALAGANELEVAQGGRAPSDLFVPKLSVIIEGHTNKTPGARPMLLKGPGEKALKAGPLAVTIEAGTGEEDAE